MFRPVLNVGIVFSPTETAPPVRGLRAVYDSRSLTANTPKSRSSKPGPLEVPYTAFRAEGPGSVGYPRRCNPKRIRDDRHRRGLIQNGHGGSLGRARLHHLIDMVSQEHRADPKPIVDLNRGCDAVHVTPEINIHQHQVWADARRLREWPPAPRPQTRRATYPSAWRRSARPRPQSGELQRSRREVAVGTWLTAWLPPSERVPFPNSQARIAKLD